MGSESQWVTFKTSGETFGFEIEYVKEMLRMPEVNAVPCAAPDNLGVILLRSEVIPVFDLRRRFGMESRQEQAAEQITSLKARLEDHRHWVDELRRCVEEKREFTLTTDPHKCAFGIWYDSFTTDDPTISRILKKFDAPHRQIHAIGEEIKELQCQELYDRAIHLINSSVGRVLKALEEVFLEAIDQFAESARPSLIVVGTSACTLGVAVDEIHAVIRCCDEDIQSPGSIPGAERFPGLIGLVATKGTDKFTMLLDPTQLYPQLIPQSVLV